MGQHGAGVDEDRALLLDLRSGEDVEAIFHELFRRFHRRLLAFFARRGLDPEFGRELSQETFLRVFRTRQEFRGEVPLASWVFQIAANLFRNEIRRRRTGKRRGQEVSLDDVKTGPEPLDHPSGLDEPESAEAGPLERLLGTELADALRGALDELPPRSRRVMQMRVLHGYEVAEIAVAMKITESTVKVHLHQARERLRRSLRDRFGELPF